MADKRIENLNVFSEDPLPTPDALKQIYPLTEDAVKTVSHGQAMVKAILDRADPRLIVIVGPCSVHDVESAREYAQCLKKLADRVGDTLCIVMRVYFEKPRTRIGWHGLINDPHLNGSCDIEEGLKRARMLLLDIAKIGLPVAGEALDLVSPQYIQDLFAWTSIGARTTESQTHRKMASGFTSSVGFKNGTHGDIQIAINAIHAAVKPNNFISIDPQGQVAVIRTSGNAHTHIVLRGGTEGPNYDPVSIATCEVELAKADLPLNIMVDCSHANSRKNPQNQLQVLDSIKQQVLDGNQSIIGVMLESNLQAGNQAIPEDLSKLRYGVSVTDACLDWESTEAAILTFHEQTSGVLKDRF